ncbi:recombinase family protein [Promicromonospora soli]
MKWDDAPDASYRRISDDKTGEGLGVARQNEDNIVIAERHGRTLLSPAYDDNDITAADPHVLRPDFERLLEDLRAGIVNGIVVYHMDRLCREQMDLDRLIKIYDAAGDEGRRIRPIATMGMSYDLHTDEGVAMATLIVMMANQEVRATRRRVTRWHADAAQKGKVPGGPVPFGWKADRQTLDPVKEAAIRDAIQALTAGEMGWGQIAVTWNEAGLLTPFGKAWIGANVRATLRSPRLAGIRTFKEEPVINDDGSYVMGKWQPILTLDDWEAWWSLVGPDRGGGGDRERRDHTLSGVLRCGRPRCRKKLTGKRDKTRAIIYVCPPKGAGGCGGTSIRGKVAESLVEEMVLRRYETRQALRLTSVAFTGEAELAEVRASIEVLFTEVQAGKPAARRMVAIEALEEREAELMRAKNQAGARIERENKIWGDLRKEWASKSNKAKRDHILDALIMVIVMPHTGPNNRVNPDRLVPVWVDDQGTEAGKASTQESR